MLLISRLQILGWLVMWSVRVSTLLQEGRCHWNGQHSRLTVTMHYKIINMTTLQAIMYNKYSVMSDVWSFGCVMYEVWSLGHNPFEGVQVKEVSNPGCSDIKLLAVHLFSYTNSISAVCKKDWWWAETPSTSWLF